jgi:hypothetical protein
VPDQVAYRIRPGWAEQFLELARDPPLRRIDIDEHRAIAIASTTRGASDSTV